MHKKKSQKRLGTRREYWNTVYDKASLFVFGCVGIGAGVGFVALALALFIVQPLVGLMVFAMSAGLFWFGKYMLVESKSIERIEIVTDRNAHLLPLQDTLVRAADLPPTEQPSELLRAIQSGQETPPEQLLRSVAGDEYHR